MTLSDDELIERFKSDALALAKMRIAKVDPMPAFMLLALPDGSFAFVELPPFQAAEKPGFAATLRMVIRHMNASAYALAMEAWMARGTGDRSIDGLQVSKRNDRTEALMLSIETRSGTAQGFVADIDRESDGKRTLGPLAAMTGAMAGRFAHLFDDPPTEKRSS